MDRLTTFFGRLVRRQDGELPIDIDIPLPIPTPSTTGRSSTPSASLPTSTPTSTSTSTSQVSTSTVPPPSQTPIITSATSTQISTTTSQASDPTVILVQTTLSPTAGNENTGTSLPPASNTQTSIVIENKTVTNPAKTSSSGLPDRAGAAKSSFLDNKVASGIVFGLCGLVGLLLILLIVWFAMRKRRRIKKLEKEIISFDPEDVGHFHQRKDIETASINSLEKGRSASSLDHYAGSGYAPTMNADNVDYRNAAPLADYHPQQQMAVQHPGNAAFNPMSRSDLNYSRSLVKQPQHFNR